MAARNATSAFPRQPTTCIVNHIPSYFTKKWQLVKLEPICFHSKATNYQNTQRHTNHTRSIAIFYLNANYLDEPLISSSHDATKQFISTFNLTTNQKIATIMVLTARMAAYQGSFKHIHQVALICTASKSNTWQLGPTRVCPSPMASQSVQLFLQGSW